MTAPDKDPLLTGPQAAARLGIATATWRAYVFRGLAPKADDPDEGESVYRRSPRWRTSTVDAFSASRRGQGWRGTTNNGKA